MRWSMTGPSVLPRLANVDCRLTRERCIAGFDPPSFRARLDGRRPPAHIPPVTRMTHRAGDRRISLPGPAGARAVLIRRQFAEDLSDVVAIVVRCLGRR